MVLNKGERASNFASELDNMVNVAQFESMLVGPVFDADGICRGAVQFVNRCDGDDNLITADLIEEISSLLPTLGEIIRAADKVRNIYNIMTNINIHMQAAKEGIENKLTSITHKDF